MKKLLAVLLAGLLLITSMSVTVWADDEEVDRSAPAWDDGGILPGLVFYSLGELFEYVDELDEEYVSKADEMGFGEGVLEYLYYEMDGVYLPDGVGFDDFNDIYVDPNYIEVTFRYGDRWVTLYYFVMRKDGEDYTKRYVTLAKNSGKVITLENSTEVYYCRYAGEENYVFVQDGNYYLIARREGAYDEGMLDFCNVSYHTFGEAYNLEAESGVGKVKLTWDEIVDDSTYTVYWKRSTSDEWRVACETSKKKVNITGLKSGTSYDFKIEATGIESEVVTITAE
ncbi:MAG: fibronectin type III domain-containing protein [Oscillospiraceae bacterium]|nr:fibronectin type III domain-containing protein [Oscillospiraceae bacterium]